MNITRETLFEEGAYFPSCHASTVLPMDNGVILVAYFAGTHEKADDVGIWLSRRIEGTWRAPERIAKVNETAHWNPVLMPIPGGAKIIFKVGREIPDWQSWTMTTSDYGESWTEPKPYGAGIACGPVRNKPLYLSDGSILAPNSVETSEDWRPKVDMSYDCGASFPDSCNIPIELNSGSVNAISGKGAIQPTLWESAQGHIHALLRTTGGYIFRSDSDDFGRSWSVAYNTGIPNNNSGIDIAKLNGKLYLALNPVSGNWAARTPLSVYVSDDNGVSFSPYCVLEDEIYDPYQSKTGDKPTAEFSYPAIVAKADKLHITYTYMRRSVCYREISV